MKRSWGFRWFAVVLLVWFSGLAWAETTELVTYYPAPANNNLHVSSSTVGTAYQNENPGDGMLLIADRVGIGTTDPQERLEINGNLRLTSTSCTSGIIWSGGSLYIHNCGTNNFFAGVAAGNLNINTAATDNTGVGAGALYSNTSGNYNTATGSQALYFDDNGRYNTAAGYAALYSNTSGNYNTATGSQTLYSNTSGYENIATGSQALYSNIQGYYNTATGVQALYSNVDGYANTATGWQALYSNTSGNYNTATGWQALYSNTGANENTATGYQALCFNTNGQNNTATGHQALYSNINGSNNTATGFGALYSNTHGNNNTATGGEALYSNAGDNNTATGDGALHSNTGANENTATGVAALYSNTTGNNNTAIGDHAGAKVPANANVSGSQNTFIGYNAGPGTSTQLTNATAIGNGALVSADNALVLGNTSVTVGIGTATPSSTYKLYVAGSIYGTNLTETSDLRFKTHIIELTHVLDKLDGIHGVSFDWNERYKSLGRATGHREIGLIAQEVEGAFPELVTQDADGEQYRAIDYGRFSSVLLQAIKELKTENEALKQQASADRKRLATLEQAVQRKNKTR